MTWLITGGAGYIGAHVVRAARAAGYHVVVLDDLSSGVAARLPVDVPLVTGSVTDPLAVRGVFDGFDVHGVVHLAGRKSAPDSVRDPLTYYRVNVTGLVVLLEAMAYTAVSRLVFSSSAAVYGKSDAMLLTESSAVRPLNPYGRTKLVGEQLIRAYGEASDLSWTALRYFNVVGAGAPDLADRGLDNLLPRVLRTAATGDPITVNGGRLATPDGTAVRDYVHVSDLAAAHLAAMGAASSGHCAAVYNVGTGVGSSVLDVLRTVAEVTGLPTPYRVGPPDAAAPAWAVADAARIGRELGWLARFTLLESVESLWPIDHRLATAAPERM